jgi:hypothetical protein
MRVLKVQVIDCTDPENPLFTEDVEVPGESDQADVNYALREVTGQLP